MLWLANKPDSKYEGKMKVVQVESTNKDAGKACVGDRVKIESPGRHWGGCSCSGALGRAPKKFKWWVFGGFLVHGNFLPASR